MSVNLHPYSVEHWLGGVEARMRASVREHVARSRGAYASSERRAWCLEWPAMVVLCVGQLYWTLGAEEAIRGKQGGAG